MITIKIQMMPLKKWMAPYLKEIELLFRRQAITKIEEDPQVVDQVRMIGALIVDARVIGTYKI